MSVTSPEQTRILLTGATGQVGGDLLPLLQSVGQVFAPGRSELDLSSSSAIRKYVRETKPHWIINPAAYTAVDKAESESDLAQAINVDAIRALGEEARLLDAAVIHFSTDYVFDGTGTKPWRETDSPNPLGVYGRTKLEGEQALAQTGAAHLIFRTSWVFASHGKNFLLTMLRLARERDELRVVADQHGAPTWSFHLAELVASIVRRGETEESTKHGARVDYVRQQQGVYHAASSGETSWFGFAEEIVRLAATALPNRQWATVVPITTADYPTPARRPENSRLDCTKLQHAFGFVMPSWQTATASVVATVLAEDAARNG